MRQTIAAFVALVVAVPVFGKDTWYRAFGPDGNHLIIACKAALRAEDAGDGKGTGSHQDATAPAIVEVW